MSVIIRVAQNSDYIAVQALLRRAFSRADYDTYPEHLLVERLRLSDAFVPQLSMVALIDGVVVGYIMMTKIVIHALTGEAFDSLSLAPVAVLPEYQCRGVGKELIREVHAQARELGFRSAVVLGHETYYPRFGYRMAKAYGIKIPIDAPAENCMVVALVDGGLNGVSGVVEYPVEFGI